MPRTRHARLDCSPGCAVEATLRFIDGKWKGVIIWHLLAETLRFNQLRELEQDGPRRAPHLYAQIPPRVEYSLTERGRTLAPVLLALKAWGGCAWGGGGEGGRGGVSATNIP